MKKRLKAIEAKIAQNGCVLTEAHKKSLALPADFYRHVLKVSAR